MPSDRPVVEAGILFDGGQIKTRPNMEDVLPDGLLDEWREGFGWIAYKPVFPKGLFERDTLLEIAGRGPGGEDPVDRISNLVVRLVEEAGERIREKIREAREAAGGGQS